MADDEAVEARKRDLAIDSADAIVRLTPGIFEERVGLDWTKRKHIHLNFSSQF